MKIGQAYMLKATVTLTGRCNDAGCGSGKELNKEIHYPSLEFRYHVSMVDGTKRSVAVLAQGGTMIVPPVSGTLEFVQLHDPPITKKMLLQEFSHQCDNLELLGYELESWSLKPKSEVHE